LHSAQIRGGTCQQGADPNALSAWGDRALHHSLARGNALQLLESRLDFGADPTLRAPGPDELSAVAVAARAGRADALELFRRCGFATELNGDDAFFAALSRGDRAGTLVFVAAEPRIAERLEASQPGIVATFAGAGNTAAVGFALDLGFPLPADALAVAVWRERTETVRLLLARGAPVSASELSLAERAVTEMSEWTPHHSREILDALQADASDATMTLDQALDHASTAARSGTRDGVRVQSPKQGATSSAARP
jgi:hypothetical protein